MQVAKEVIFVVTNNPVAKNQIMHPSADVDRVNLNKTKVRQDCIDVFHRRVEQ